MDSDRVLKIAKRMATRTTIIIIISDNRCKGESIFSILDIIAQVVLFPRHQDRILFYMLGGGIGVIFLQFPAHKNGVCITN